MLPKRGVQTGDTTLEGGKGRYEKIYARASGDLYPFISRGVHGYAWVCGEQGIRTCRFCPVVPVAAACRAGRRLHTFVFS